MTETIQNNLNELIKDLKKTDSNYANIVKGIEIVYWIIIPLFLVLTLRHVFQNVPIMQTVGSLFILISLFILAFLMRYYSKYHSKVDYSLPTLQMLKKAAYRYKPFQKQTLWVLLALILMDIGLVLKDLPTRSFLQTQIFFGSSLALGVIGGLIWWYIRFKPLRDGALKLIRDIEGN